MRQIQLLTLLALLCSCADDLSSSQQPRLVVEGWIDDGGFPIVFVTTSIPFKADMPSDYDISSHVIDWAKVSISDGERKVYLSGRVQHQYPVPYVYTTGELRGQSGHTYTLIVDCPPFFAKATTTIPHRAKVDSFRTLPVEGNDTLFQLFACVSHKVDEAGGYKFFVKRKGKDDDYISSYMGLYSQKNISPISELPVYNGHKMNNKDFTPYFSIRDTLRVKFAAVGQDSYDFWTDYEAMVSLSRNPFFASGNNMRSNVNGALGYWCGYGANQYTIMPPKRKQALPSGQKQKHIEDNHHHLQKQRKIEQQPIKGNCANLPHKPLPASQ